MTIDNDDDLRGLMRIGEICGTVLNEMLARVEPGMTTKQLDDIGAALFKQYGARSAPILAYNYPGYTCISLNDEAAHGIPRKDRKIQAGDIINVDVSAELEGYWADTAASMPVPPVNKDYERLCRFAKTARDEAIKAVRAGAPLNSIGKAVEGVAQTGGYRIVRQLTGHGVGRHIHEKPTVLGYYNRHDKEPMQDGMVFTVEPFLSPGRAVIYTERDGWTLRTTDGAVVAQFEHTVVVDGDHAVLVTAV
ncbi:type I methionyl aminopeptidase [Aggregatilinea lenta]|uniref:type I methionyl aminopeptidase n=1 Tax=Aggregatilinea lenta TaxID=913108 RepID=UPI000E5C21A8|nr:type I methionyl aminopeptidase [Aggregatilinea lenta]